MSQTDTVFLIRVLHCERRSLYGAGEGMSTHSTARQHKGRLHAGDGIGPEISEAVKRIFKAAEVPIDWDHQYVGTEVDERTNSMISRENLDSVLVRHVLPPNLSSHTSASNPDGIAQRHAVAVPEMLLADFKRRHGRQRHTPQLQQALRLPDAALRAALSPA